MRRPIYVELQYEGDRMVHYEIEARDEHGNWDPEYCGDNTVFATKIEARKAINSLRAMGWGPGPRYRIVEKVRG
jgi:hypothetical protein